MEFKVLQITYLQIISMYHNMPDIFIIPWKGLMAKSWRPSKENKAALFIVSCLHLYPQGHIRNYTKKRLRDHSDERKAMPIYCNGYKKFWKSISCNFLLKSDSFNVLKVQVFLLRRPQKCDQISQFLCRLQNKCQTNWEILPNLCGPDRKPELY